MTIGLMGAMQQETQPVINSIEGLEIEQHIKQTFYRGIIAGQEVVAVQSGIGKVRSATSCQFLIEHFGVNRVIFAGIAGALKPEISIGDIVISDRVVEWDFQSNIFGTTWYQADADLVALALSVAQSLGRKAWIGSVLTGDRLVVNSNHKDELRRTFNGDCVDMEGAAVGLVCSMNKVPFVLIRAISDYADESTDQELIHSLDEVAPLPARVVLRMLKEQRSHCCLPQSVVSLSNHSL